MKKIFFLTITLCILSCGSSSVSELFNEPRLLAVDSTNDRLFVLENDQILILLTASTREKVGTQPMVNDERLTDIQSLLPSSPTHMVAESLGGSTRLFITGVQADAAGDQVTNQILVLDYDGTNLTEAAFSPIIVEDGAADTIDTNNILGGMLLEQDNDRLYVTDATAGALYILTASDGSAAAAPLAIAGTPNAISLDDNHLYVANNTATAANQLVTVVNTDDFSTTTIDLDIPTDDIAVATVASGTILLAKQSNLQKVMIRTVDTTTFVTATAIPVGDTSAANGEITSAGGISSSVGILSLLADDAGTPYGYVPQSDGNITLISFASGLGSFTATTLSTVTKVLSSIDRYNPADGSTDVVYMTASSSGDLVFTDLGSSSVSAHF